MKKSKVIGVIVLVVLVAAMAVAYVSFSEKPTQGEKKVTIEVITADETSSLYEELLKNTPYRLCSKWG